MYMSRLNSSSFLYQWYELFTVCNPKRRNPKTYKSDVQDWSCVIYCRCTHITCIRVVRKIRDTVNNEERNFNDMTLFFIFIKSYKEALNISNVNFR